MHWGGALGALQLVMIISVCRNIQLCCQDSEVLVGEPRGEDHFHPARAKAAGGDALGGGSGAPTVAHGGAKVTQAELESPRGQPL